MNKGTIETPLVLDEDVQNEKNYYKSESNNTPGKYNDQLEDEEEVNIEKSYYSQNINDTPEDNKPKEKIKIQKEFIFKIIIWVLFSIIYLMMITKIFLMFIFHFFTLDFVCIIFSAINLCIFNSATKDGEHIHEQVVTSIIVFGLIPCLGDFFLINSFSENLLEIIVVTCKILSIANCFSYIVILVLYCVLTIKKEDALNE
jgi:hypothetical protein